MLRFICLTAISLAPCLAQTVATVQVQRALQGAPVPKDFMGLSVEQSSASTYFGAPKAYNSVLFAMLKNLGQGNLRIGGAASDSACWSGQTAPDPSICQYSLASSDFYSWFNASAQTSWSVIIGVSLAQNEAAGAPQYILNEVTQGILPALKSFPHASLLALELGNELNLYSMNPTYRPPTYDVDDQVADLLDYITVLKSNSSTASILLAAPAYYNPSASTVTSQLDPLMSGVLDCATCGTANLGLATVHEYALNTTKTAVTIQALMSPALIQLITTNFQKVGTDMRNLFHINAQIDETNTVQPDPGQPGVSDVQASAIWALDYALQMARVGIRRMNFHIHDGAVYNPIVISSPSPGVFTNQVQPQYYGLYAFSAAKGQTFLPVTISTSANIRAYALSTCSTCATTVYLINKDLSASGSVQINLSSPAHAATYLEMVAPALSSPASAVTYGGVQFSNATGLLNGTVQTTAVEPDDTGAYTVILDNAAAGILTIQP